MIVPRLSAADTLHEMAIFLTNNHPVSARYGIESVLADYWGDSQMSSVFEIFVQLFLDFLGVKQKAPLPPTLL